MGSIWTVQPVWNAKNVPLSQGPGTLPNMADTIMNWFQLLTFYQITKTVDPTFQIQESTTAVQFQGVVIRFTPQQLRMKPEGQRQWRWNAIYTLPSTPLKPDDVLTTQDGLSYRIMDKVDYTQYGYIEYHAIEDYTETFTVGSPTPAFLPSQIPGLAAWYEADQQVYSDLAGIQGVGDGSPVNRWNDLSGNGFTLTRTAGAGSDPTFAANVLIRKPTVVFGGLTGSQFLETAATTGSGPLDLSTGYSFAVVFYVSALKSKWIPPNGYSDLMYLFCKSNSSTLNNFTEFSAFLLGSPSGVGLPQANDQWYNGQFPFQSLITQPLNLNQYYLFEGVFSTTSVEIYLNGIQVGSIATVGGSIHSHAGSLVVGGLVGLFLASNGGWFPGGINSLMVFNKALTDSQRQQLEQYLNNKYSVY